MPYIKDKARETLRNKIPGEDIKDAGELNFILADIVDDYLLKRKRFNYVALNEVIGVLECLKLEVYRRILAPYENQKLKENGEVFFSRTDRSNPA